MGFVYLIEDSNNNVYKIGVTKDLDKRIKSLQTGNACELKFLCAYSTKYPYRLETMLHNKFSQYKELNEWYNLPKDIVLDFHSQCAQMNSIIETIIDNPYFSKKIK